MPLNWSRYTALIFAIGLAIGEAVINWGHWQYAPLWLVDYAIVVWLLTGFLLARNPAKRLTLATGWAFTCGVFYMALFVTLDSIRTGRMAFADRSVIIVLIAIMLGFATAGLVTAALPARVRSPE
ncbi:MAG: hypothetical protein AMXMBFR4_17800 [Candidatus Hydrogenedentota bacterium]